MTTCLFHIFRQDKVSGYSSHVVVIQRRTQQRVAVTRRGRYSRSVLKLFSRFRDRCERVRFRHCC